jgi:hypothetical protein
VGVANWMTTWISESVIREYFDVFLFGFILNDIKQCIKAKANYVIALALLSYTEYVGALISGNIGLKGRGIPRKNFHNALEYFPKEYLDIDAKIQVEYIDNNGKRKKEKGIYSLYRCGMVHEYFVKGDSIIHNNPYGQLKSHIGIIKDKGKFKFHTNEYFRDFQSAIKKIYKKILDDFEVDLKLASKSQGEYLQESDLNSALLKGFCKSLSMYSSRKII